MRYEFDSRHWSICRIETGERGDEVLLKADRDINKSELKILKQIELDKRPKYCEGTFQDWFVGRSSSLLQLVWLKGSACDC